MMNLLAPGRLMRLLLINLMLLSVYSFSISCKNLEKHDATNFQSYCFIDLRARMYKTGALKYFLDSVKITYYSNFIIYKIPVHHDIQENEEIKKEWFTYRYCIYDKESIEGKVIYKDSVIEKFNVDEFLLSYSTKNYAENLYNITTKDKLVQSISNNGEYALVEVYTAENKKDMYKEDTAKYYYSYSDESSPFSLCAKLDSIKKLKLVKIDFIYNAIKDIGNGVGMPSRYEYIKLVKIPNEDTMYMKKLIEKYFSYSK